MGNSSYSIKNRIDSGRSAFYSKATRDEIFTQNVKREVHESMDPKGITLRESRDSENNPNSVPIILGLDLTGSMGHIPHDLIQDGLPNLVSGIIQNGTPDPALLFLGIGDHEVDNVPLQVGQFESGDEELDMWLTRTYIESGGGGNEGESYHLAWYFAAHHTVHDAWEKRKKKGYLFTVGDEPCLPNLPSHAITEIMGSGRGNYSKEELLKAASERYEVYHIHVNHRPGRYDAVGQWKQTLGDRCIVTDDYKAVPNIIKDIVTEIKEEPKKDNGSSGEEVEIL